MQAKRRNAWPQWLQSHPQNKGKHTRRVLVERYHGRGHAAMYSAGGNRSRFFWRQHVTKQRFAGRTHRRNLHPARGRSMHWRNKIKQEMTSSLRRDLREKRAVQKAVAPIRARYQGFSTARSDKGVKPTPSKGHISPMKSFSSVSSPSSFRPNRRVQSPMKLSDPPKKASPNRRIQKPMRQLPSKEPSTPTKMPAKQQGNPTPAKPSPQKNITNSPSPNRRIQKAVKQAPTKSPPTPAKTQQQVTPTPAKPSPTKPPQQGSSNRRVQHAKKVSQTPAKPSPQKTKQVKSPTKGK